MSLKCIENLGNQEVSLRSFGRRLKCSTHTRTQVRRYWVVANMYRREGQIVHIVTRRRRIKRTMFHIHLHRQVLGVTTEIGFNDILFVRR